MDKNRLLTSRQVEGLIADGHAIVIYAGHALRLDAWLNRHPGGRLPILHMVGRDATDEINAYHLLKTQRLMLAYRIGKIQQPWVNFVPPLRGGVYRKYPDTSTAISDSVVIDDDNWLVWDTDSSSQSSAISGLATPRDPLPVGLEEITNKDLTEDTTKTTNVVAQQLIVESGNELVEYVGQMEVLPKINRKHAILKERNSSISRELSREAYTVALEQQEINDGIRSYPSLDIETQRAISLEYQLLHEQIKEAGFYECRYSEYGKDSIRWFILFGAFLYFLNAKWYLTSAVFLGMFWQQIMFTAHDAGHRGITGNFVADTLIGAFVADFCCGLSIGWWKSSHNVHHLITNMPEHDPDQQNVPLFATSPTFFKSVLSTFYDFSFVWDSSADFLVRYQAWTYYPIMAVARFNLYFLSWRHLLFPNASNRGSVWWTGPVEIAMMLGYWILYGYGLVWHTLPNWPIRIAFVLISHSITMLLHVQITLSHWGMPTADLGPTESFPQRQLRTTMDVDCPPWLDFLHGGLQFQAVHHLFPRVPRHNLRQVQLLVRKFCTKTHIKYKCYAFVEGNKIVLSRLQEVAKMVDTLAQCQVHMSETGESGLH